MRERSRVEVTRYYNWRRVAEETAAAITSVLEEGR